MKNKSIKRGMAPLRFAHPFFTTQPVAARKPVPGIGSQLLNHIQGHLQPIPAPKRTPVMTLVDIIGAQGSQEIEASGALRFHSVATPAKAQIRLKATSPRP